MRANSLAWLSCGLSLLIQPTIPLRYDPAYAAYNLNTNEDAYSPLQYSGSWQNHKFTPSPENWRMPFYTIMLDRFANGDPSNDNINGTQFEHDPTQTTLRHGGDVKGLQDSLDYLQGMGIKALYLAGSPHINEPWSADGYSPLDLTLLDHHFGTIAEWQAVIEDIHRRGMYVVLDNTMSTMGDLIGFEGYLNTSTPFAKGEHNALWKGEKRYHDFNIGNDEIPHCRYPRFYDDDGREITNVTGSVFTGCRDSEFDQYGEIAAFGNYPEWQRQVSKFAFVQDRLREWRSDVLAKIENFACLTVGMLDIDGYRMDKGLQITVDAQGHWSDSVRQCAKKYGKDNFYISGEIVSGNAFGSVYIGRGRTPDNYVSNVTEAVQMTNESDPKFFIRDEGHQAFDGAAFHYTVYRFLTRFLGVDGTFGAEGDPPTDWVEFWTALLQTNDMINANTGKFDPRHMYGVTNQDVFRWPGIKNGTQKHLLGQFIITLLLPGGLPTLVFGEEQAFYVLDSTAGNYVFGRSPMTSSQAWGMHGCFTGDNEKYFEWPVDSSSRGCQDPWVPLDHRDPSAPLRNIMKSSYEMRENYPVLKDGFSLQQLSKQTYNVYLPGSGGTATETGLWSMERASFNAVQTINQTAWLVYTNENKSTMFNFNCRDKSLALVAPFEGGTIVKNMYFPYDEYNLEEVDWPGGETQDSPQGCLSNFQMPAWGYKAFVPKEDWIAPSPVITKFLPGHDARLASASSVKIEFHFSAEMDCDQIKRNIYVNSTTEKAQQAQLSNVQCSKMDAVNENTMAWVGSVESVWSLMADMTSVSDGIHQITINNATTEDGDASTNSVDHFLLRVGQPNNPIVFPSSANYTSELLLSDNGKNMQISHMAPGADQFRYSLNFGTTYSDWEPYGDGGLTRLAPKVWSGSKAQAWKGEHVIVQYWSRLAGSSAHVQQGDLNYEKPRRFPNMWLQGTFNQYGFDAGFANQMKMGLDSIWRFNFMAEWPARAALNAWGMNPDGQPDQTRVYGDIEGDNILDRIPPLSLIKNAINISESPPSPYLSWRIDLNDADLRYQLIPVGSRWHQLAIYLILWIVPLATAVLGVVLFMKSFYGVKLNEIGITEKKSVALTMRRRALRESQQSEVTMVDNDARSSAMTLAGSGTPHLKLPPTPGTETPPSQTLGISHAFANRMKRKTVLIATMEYDIEDWAIKIKIGGLGVMANLMSKNLAHQDLIWVIPCVGGVEYPIDQRADSIVITVLGNLYEIKVQYHKLRNITYVLLDAPIFRQQTKQDPYPPRMDDLHSACYYSAWNSCIAEMMRRFPIDLYHINDYHGTVAPLHLLPVVVPCVLSLHNAEFQGLWPMRTESEKDEVCDAFDLDPDIVTKYVQFGEVFNLLHAGASYLREHQKGFGAVGVSNKYGKRVFARYPILWGLRDVGALPNPDPTDTAPWNKQQIKTSEIHIDEALEQAKPGLKLEAQQWANLNEDPEAELFVFVGRWSMQKGIDSIADVFPSVMEQNEHVQLICVGPVIDLYGGFAAMKLARMMEVYPGRVFSKPEFTALPPCIFSGADFALMPSRDEPFGLVAVEFGRKGALCVGARVGGLGHMPGWWFTIESTTTKHFMQQFKIAIQGALASKPDTRAIMRARAAKQRFPVAQWVEDLEKLQNRAIEISDKRRVKNRSSLASKVSYSNLSIPRKPMPSRSPRSRPATPTHLTTPTHSRSASKRFSNGPNSGMGSESDGMRPSRPSTPSGGFGSIPPVGGLGSRYGPGSNEARIQKWRQAGSLSVPGSAQVSDSEMTDEEEERKKIKRYSIGTAVSSPGNSPVVSPIGSPTEERSSYFDAPVSTRLDAPVSSRFEPPSSDANWPFVNNSSAPSNAPTLDVQIADIPVQIQSDSSSGASMNETPGYATLNLKDIVGDRNEYELQNVSPFFTDPKKEFANLYKQKLEKLNGKTSEDALCIEEYLTKSEKKWFTKLRQAELAPKATPPPSVYKGERFSRAQAYRAGLKSRPNTRPSSPHAQRSVHSNILDENAAPDRNESFDEFMLGNDYAPPTGLQHILRLKLGDWPLYSILLALGQIIAANSYQITLLTGSVGQPASKLYVIASLYLASSIGWWLLYRRFSTVYILSAPFAVYGFAFLLIGLAPVNPSFVSRGWIQNVASALYSIASSSGSIYFAVNFGDEGGAPVHAWTWRACVIQGTQQIYVVALWFWGSALTKSTDVSASGSSAAAAGKSVIVPLGILLACFMWSVAAILYIGLPKYYRQTPGNIPSFYTSLFRRKIISWFFLVVALQNYFLSAPYGRNWLYLWSSQHAPSYAIALLIILFFVVVWAAFLLIFGKLSKHHSWILPIFAMGLGAPRWAQMFWATSNIGAYIPWAGGAVQSALVGRSVWLWLGVLDALQGVGFGMILLQTLTRFHVLFTLLAAQVIGSFFTILARATAPNKIGPGDVFPDFSSDVGEGLGKAWFWVALLCQLVCPVGFFVFFRKEQLSKP